MYLEFKGGAFLTIIHLIDAIIFFQFQQKYFFRARKKMSGTFLRFGILVRFSIVNPIGFTIDHVRQSEVDFFKTFWIKLRSFKWFFQNPSWSFSGLKGLLQSLWKLHQSKAMTFLHRNYIPTFFSTPKTKIFFRCQKKSRPDFGIFSKTSTFFRRCGECGTAPRPQTTLASGREKKRLAGGGGGHAGPGRGAGDWLSP